MDVRQPKIMDVNTWHDQPRLLISREALLHNIRLIRRQLSPGTRICAMIKADAYGHGADVVADALCNFEHEGLPTPAVDMLAVASLDEAAVVAEASLPLVVFRPIENGYIGPARPAVEHAIRHGWILTVGSGSAVDDISRIAMSLNRRALIHVMVDTGMTRCGCSIELLPELLSRIESQTSLKLTSLGTQLATADACDHPFTSEQVGRFHAATDECIKKNKRLLRTVANSGGIFFSPASHFDMVRPGISMYGLDPTCQPNLNRPLKPVARWVAPIISILSANAGTKVGYGHTWETPRDTRIGVVPVGYADGYFRQLGNRAKMLVQGLAVPVVGRVSMDMITIDLHDVPAAQIGDEVTVLDDDPVSPASAYALAGLAGTVPYEVFTRIGPRVRRVAVDRNSKCPTADLISAEKSAS